MTVAEMKVRICEQDEIIDRLSSKLGETNDELLERKEEVELYKQNWASMKMKLKEYKRNSSEQSV